MSASGHGAARLPTTAHTSRRWRIHEITADFRVEDVWAVPARGSQDDFPRLVELIVSTDASQIGSTAARFLWTARLKLGQVLGWDRRERGLGTRVRTLRDRLPPDLLDAPLGPINENSPFSPLYLLADEWAAEIANETVQGVIHVGWVPEEAGEFHAQLAILVKPNGRFGVAYMAAIKPFRYLIVYPALMRHLERSWLTLRSDRPTEGDDDGALQEA